MSIIIPRSTWGAAPPRSLSRTIWTKSTLWVHHSVGARPSNNPAAERQTVRDIQRFHQGPQRGWADIGYSYLIAVDSGRIYEGRGANIWGAHCPGHNDEPSVCLMGNFGTVVPPDAALRAVWALADHIGMGNLKGHREGFPTSCPGDAGMRAIVRAPRPTPAGAVTGPLPHGATLRLVVNGRAWAGWDQAANPLINISRKGLKPTAQTAIAWRGNVWRGSTDVTNVAKNLVTRFL